MYGILDDDGNIIAEFVVPLTLRSNKPVFVNDSLSLKRVTKTRSSQRWELAARLTPLSENANDLMVHLIDKGVTTPFNIVIPQNTGVMKRRTNQGSVTLAAATLIGDNQVNIKFSSGLLPKGTFIKFTAAGKVHMTLDDVTAPSGITRVHPPMRQARAINSTVYAGKSITMPVYYDIDTVQGMQYEDGILMDMGRLTFIEAV